jgi:hypothetical protein
MAWMTDPHAAQILRGLYPDQYAGWWKVWLRYGFVVLLAGIACRRDILKDAAILAAHRAGYPRSRRADGFSENALDHIDGDAINRGDPMA